MSYILDNSPDRKVITTIEKLIDKSKEANFAVGYFFLSGWNLIKDKLPKDMKKGFFKILIGRELDFPTFKEISTGYKLRIKTKLLEDLSGELSIDNIKNLTALYQLIQDGYADFKVFTEGKLHSKLYLFINNPSQLEDLINIKSFQNIKTLISLTQFKFIKVILINYIGYVILFYLHYITIIKINRGKKMQILKNIT